MVFKKFVAIIVSTLLTLYIVKMKCDLHFFAIIITPPKRCEYCVQKGVLVNTTLHFLQ